MKRRADRLARLERWTEWPLTVLALLLIPVLLAPELFELDSETEAVFDALDYLIWGVFAADLLAKVAIASARGRYLRTHWVELFGDAGYLIFDPAWEPVTWHEADGELWERIGA